MSTKENSELHVTPYVRSVVAIVILVILVNSIYELIEGEYRTSLSVCVILMSLLYIGKSTRVDKRSN